MELQTLLGNKIFKMGFRERARVSQTHKAVGRLSRENHKGLEEKETRWYAKECEKFSMPGRQSNHRNSRILVRTRL